MSSVDDLEELIATRRLHGLDDNLFKEETMTEETFNDLIDNFEVIENLTLYGRTIIKTNVRRLQLRIKELEAKLEFKKWGDLDDIQFEEYMNYFIPKQKIKDKLETREERLIEGKKTYTNKIRINELHVIKRVLLEEK